MTDTTASEAFPAFENPSVPGTPVAGPGEDITQPPQRPQEPTPAFDVNSLTLGEVAAIENFSGLSIGALSDPSAQKGLLLQGLAWAIMHRRDPKFTFATAATTTFGEIQKLMAGSGDEAPSV